MVLRAHQMCRRSYRTSSIIKLFLRSFELVDILSVPSSLFLFYQAPYLEAASSSKISRLSFAAGRLWRKTVHGRFFRRVITVCSSERAIVVFPVQCVGVDKHDRNYQSAIVYGLRHFARPLTAKVCEHCIMT